MTKDAVASHLAFDALAGSAPRVIFCAGFNSNRQGNKAVALERWCAEHGYAYTRFDYSGHGDSGGEFADCTISTWLADTVAMVDASPEPSVVLVGSSMGGWLALLAALARPQKVQGLVLVACAADMTRYYPARLAGLTPQTDARGRVFYAVENQYDDGQPYQIYQQLFDDGEQHCLLSDMINLDIPVALIHGQQDDVVEWQRSRRVAQLLAGSDVTLKLIKGGDHRLSKPGELQQIFSAVASVIDSVAST